MTRNELNQSIRNIHKCLMKQISLLDKRKLPKNILFGIEINFCTKRHNRIQKLMSYYYHQRINHVK